MRLSKYFQCIEVDTNYYAIFNSILMQVIFIEKNKLKDLKNFHLSKEENDILIKNGIYESSVDMEEIYENLENNIRLQSKIPVIMYLNVSTFCNLACKYCYIETSPLSQESYLKMSSEVAKVAVDKFLATVEKTNVESSEIIFYGGEPLMNWEVIKKVIKHVRNSKFSNLKLTLITNGTLLTKDIALYLKNNKVGLGISLDGPKFINDLNRVYRNNKHSVYDNVMKSINMLNSLDCSYCVSATVTPKVIENKEKVFDWLVNSGIKNVFWNVYHYSLPSNNWEKHYNEMTDFILESYDILKNNNIGENKINEHIQMFLSQTFKFHSCGAVGLNQITVKPNGDVCICHGDSRNNDKKIGNIVDDEITDIINNKQNDTWLNMYTIDHEECKFCPALSICGGGCPLQSEVLFGDREKVDLASCIFFKKLIIWLMKRYYNDTMNL